MNEELESQGLMTLKEKLDELEKRAKGEAKARGYEVQIGDEEDAELEKCEE
jgi:hypothetical protein